MPPTGQHPGHSPVPNIARHAVREVGREYPGPYRPAAHGDNVSGRGARPPGAVGGTARPPRSAFADVEAAASLLGHRWCPSILCLLLDGPQRYNALLRQLPGATPKMLTQQLKALEDARWIDRAVVAGGSRHTEYALSARGDTLRPILDALLAWAAAETTQADAGDR